MGTSIGVQTLRSSQQFPGGAGIFPLLPLEVTGKQIERVDFLRLSMRSGLNIGAVRAPESGQRLFPQPRSPSRRVIRVIADCAGLGLRRGENLDQARRSDGMQRLTSVGDWHFSHPTEPATSARREPAGLEPKPAGEVGKKRSPARGRISQSCARRVPQMGGDGKWWNLPVWNKFRN
jgi:hypothetical protein